MNFSFIEDDNEHEEEDDDDDDDDRKEDLDSEEIKHPVAQERAAAETSAVIRHLSEEGEKKAQ